MLVQIQQYSSRVVATHYRPRIHQMLKEKLVRYKQLKWAAKLAHQNGEYKEWSKYMQQVKLAKQDLANCCEWLEISLGRKPRQH